MRTHDDVDSISRFQFRLWLSDTEVISSISGLVIVLMAVMGATGVSLKVPLSSSLEISALRR
jgi:hypothetical protein